MRNRKQHRRGGFTLVEVLIVVVILGILAATVLPQFQESTREANQSAVRRNVQTIQSQIQLFRFQHNGLFPGNGTNNLVEQLTNKTLPDGNVDNTNGTLGPYIIGDFPVNPLNGGNGVEVVPGSVPAPTLPPDYTSATGWKYSPDTGEFESAWTSP